MTKAEELEAFLDAPLTEQVDGNKTILTLSYLRGLGVGRPTEAYDKDEASDLLADYLADTLATDLVRMVGAERAQMLVEVVAITA